MTRHPRPSTASRVVNTRLFLTERKLTRLVPKSSHLPCHLGNTSKSTAKMQMTVMSIICARYTVKNGNLPFSSTPCTFVALDFLSLKEGTGDILTLESICDGTSSETPSNGDLRLLTPIIPKGSSCPELEELLGDIGDIVGSVDNRDPEANATWEGRSFAGDTAADPAAEAGSAGSSSESDSSSH